MEIIDQIHELILEDRRISSKSIAEEMGISRERVRSITHEDLDILVACFLPGRAKELSAPR
jgi:DNA-directed RNA polymerase sigma subunit (sigma70/sigma32)